MRPWPAAAALLPGSALAHAPLTGAGGFYAGLVHPLTDLPAILALLALVLVAGRAAPQPRLWAALAAAAAALAGGVAALRGVVIGPSLLAASVMALGLLAAADWRPPLALLLVLSALAGGALGLAQAVELPGTAAAAGVALAVALVLLYATRIIGRLRAAWVLLAVRIAGSWLVAIQAMILGLALR